MGIRISPGFTIIEVMLFLAITGLMVAGILASASNSLNTQRYNDGVEAIRNAISSEYAKVYNLTNSLTAADPCPAGPSSTRLWGTSQCFYTGRLIQITENGRKLTVHPVVAKENSAPAETLTERFDFSLATEEDVVETRPLEWGLSAVVPGADAAARVAILILRSPLDGTVITYNLLGADPLRVLTPASLDATMDQADTLTTAVTFCVADLGGPLDPSVRQAIIVNERATSSADIETRFGDGAEGNPTC